ncbi:MAG: creatininase family protein [Gammaproteobacteria bacterium]|nr:creatininase family protein [Gammaproteobacteria bacterium]
MIRLTHRVLLLMSLTGTYAHAGQYLGELTWEDAERAFAETPIVVIPFGAGAKEHGPHLPMKTDELVLHHLMDAAVKTSNVLVAPPILHGWFPAFRDYPGTEVADPQVFQDYVAEIAQSLVRHGARSLVFLNTGIGRATGLPLSIVAREIRANHDIPTLVVSWDDLETEKADSLYQQKRGGHADEMETSIVLFLRPDLVKMDRAVRDYRAEPVAQIGYAPGKFSRADESGVYGDPTLADAEKGRNMLEHMTANWLLALDQFAVKIR